MTKKVKSKVLEIMALALEFNGRQTKQGLTGDKPTIFVNFYGHTCQLDVSIHKQGWAYDSFPNFEDTVYLDTEKAAQKLDLLLENLKELIVDDCTKVKGR